MSERNIINNDSSSKQCQWYSFPSYTHGQTRHWTNMHDVWCVGMCVAIANPWLSTCSLIIKILIHHGAKDAMLNLDDSAPSRSVDFMWRLLMFRTTRKNAKTQKRRKSKNAKTQKRRKSKKAKTLTRETAKKRKSRYESGHFCKKTIIPKCAKQCKHNQLNMEIQKNDAE